jgi:integrase
MPKKENLEYTLEAVNRRLKEGRVGCQIVSLAGKRLNVQATCPPKPGSDRPRPYQQRIPLGLPASEDGLKEAEKAAKLIGSELLTGKFRWEKYMDPKRLPENKPVSQWVREFKLWYMERESVSPKTWNNGYGPLYSRLPQDSPLTKEVLLGVARSTAPDSRPRIEICRVFQKLADFAKVEVDLLAIKGNYGPSKVADRDLPSDELIEEWWSRIPNKRWRWIYGVMAAYGLRDHEAFFCEFRPSELYPDGLQVLKGKTGPRLVYQPLFSEWVEDWGLKDIKRPRIEDIDAAYEDGTIGHRVSRQLKGRYGTPFPPYDLRHSYAIRASVLFELPVTTASALMGHTPKVHLETYHKHISAKQNQDATRRIMQRPNRPSPPSRN